MYRAHGARRGEAKVALVILAEVGAEDGAATFDALSVGWVAHWAHLHRVPAAVLAVAPPNSPDAGGVVSRLLSAALGPVPTLLVAAGTALPTALEAVTPDVRLVVSLNGSWHPEAALPRLVGSRYDEYLGPPAAPVQVGIVATRSARDKVVGAGEAQEVLQAWAAQGAELHRLGPGLVARRGYHGVDFGPAGHEVHRDLPDDVLGLLVKAAAAVHLDAQLRG